MLNAKDYTPIISQLTDLHIWQRDISNTFIRKVSSSNNDEKLLALLNSYVEKIEELDDTLREIFVSAAYSFDDKKIKRRASNDC